MSTEDAAAQIAEEIDARHIWPLESALGQDEVWGYIRQRAQAAARVMAAQLASGDDKLAAQTAADLASLVLPGDIPAEFWTTPLGRLMAKSVGHPSADEVSPSVAAAMLGISRTRVRQLIADGRLERHPGGGVTTASVRLRAQGAV